MGGQPFLVVEYPQEDTPLASFTANVPGTSVDLISEPPVEQGDELVHPSVVLIRGAPKAQLDALLQRLAGFYSIQTIERNDQASAWTGRMRIKESMFAHNRGAQVIVQFQHRFGAPWTHIEQGMVHLRARVADTAQADVLADQMRRYFAKAGVDAQVELREISAKDYGVWDELVQRAIGLSP